VLVSLSLDLLLEGLLASPHLHHVVLQVLDLALTLRDLLGHQLLLLLLFLGGLQLSGELLHLRLVLVLNLLDLLRVSCLFKCCLFL